MLLNSHRTKKDSNSIILLRGANELWRLRRAILVDKSEEIAYAQVEEKEEDVGIWHQCGNIR